MTSPLTNNSEPIARQQSPPLPSSDPVFTVLDRYFRALHDELQWQADPANEWRDWNDESKAQLCRWLIEDHTLTLKQRVKLYLWQLLGGFPARMPMPDHIARVRIKALSEGTVKLVLQGSCAAVTTFTHWLHCLGDIDYGDMCPPQSISNSQEVISLARKRIPQAAISPEDKSSTAKYKAIVAMIALDFAFSLDEVFIDVDFTNYATEITHIESLVPRQRLQMAHRLLSQLLDVTPG
ncbi:hypothetical protein [Adonisia turfae]|uniref:Uncharacterized protein n=1 Tax=Adonisia turfae CCMR0081 TaxID=2292702 RepID=A0A6M0RXT6_9CYAN|nr:hypothetical protein [Adonisia turfae]NEZ61048.1 hypothetical protein [Adonisia turfae CCMR0081]